MCIAIYKPAGETVPAGSLEESYYSNPDGAGFAVSDGRRLTVLKGFFCFEEFMSAYEPYREFAALIHFRIATHGDVNKSNCHPFSLCEGRYALVHNGIIGIKPHGKKSDTATFADAVIAPLLRKGVQHTSQALRFLVEQAIGAGNKIAIMDRIGEVQIFNESSGHWHKGIWYSNESYRAYYRPFVWGKDKKDSLYRYDDAQDGYLRCTYCGNAYEESPDYDDVGLCEVCAEEFETA